ncbi:MAG TPA: AI-2E family transporter [Balneolaceae bacterium]|nr:AI-2E family transporter [Balneolaceae bacterium]
MSKQYPLWLKATTILLGISLLFFILSVGQFILMPLAFSALIAMLLEPVSKWFENWKLNRALSIVLSLTLLLIVMAGVISLLSIQLVGFVDQLPEANGRIQAVSSEWLQFFQTHFGIAPEQQIQYLQQALQTLINKSGKYASTALGATTSAFTTLMLLPLFVFFMMYYKNMYRRFLHWIARKDNNKAIDSVVDDIQKVTQNYIIGMMTVITILAILNGIGLWIVGIEHALFFAIFAAVLAVIPYIGIIIGSLPAVIYAFLFSQSLVQPLGVIGVFAIVQFLEGNFITPNIVGSRVSINPFMALLALLIGGELWGITGMILSVPFIGILKCIFDQVEALKPYGYLFGNSPDEYQPARPEPAASEVKE